MKMYPIHADGDPNGCRENCPGEHYEDAAPAVCKKCGGNGRACYWGCVESMNSRSEPWEGSREYGCTYDNEYGY